MSKELSPVDTLKKTISTMKSQFGRALPKHIDPDKFVRVVQTAISATPKLANADRNSFFSACLKSCADGLLPDGREAALVPFNSKNGVMVTYMPMVAGILKKVRNSGELATITSQCVFKNDTFEYWIDSTGEHVNHKPDMFGDRGKMIGAYALAKTRAGEVYIEVMSMAQLEQVRQSSRAKDSGPWKDWAEEMHRKTVIKRLSKRLPMSSDIETVIGRGDEDLYDFSDKNEDVTPPETKPEAPSQPTRTEELMNQNVEQQEPIDVQATQTETSEIPI